MTRVSKVRTIRTTKRPVRKSTLTERALARENRLQNYQLVAERELKAHIENVEINIIDLDNEDSLCREGIAQRIKGLKCRYPALGTDEHTHLATVFGVENIKRIELQRNFGFSIGDLVIKMQPANPSNITRIYRVVEDYRLTPDDITLSVKYDKRDNLKRSYKSTSTKRVWTSLHDLSAGYIKLEPVISFSAIMPQNLKARYKDLVDTNRMNFKYVPYSKVLQEIARVDLIDLGLFFKMFQGVITDLLEDKKVGCESL